MERSKQRPRKPSDEATVVDTTTANGVNSIESPGRPQLHNLTALRAFAALSIFIHHLKVFGIDASQYIRNMDLECAVSFFFVLSGFILSHVYLQPAGEKRLNYKSFLWARLSRIYPLHIATLAGIGLLGGVATLMGVAMTHDVLAWDALRVSNPGRLRPCANMSIMTLRVILAITASGTRAAAMAGRTRCARRSPVPPGKRGLYIPEVGSQPRLIAKMPISSRPNQ